MKTDLGAVLTPPRFELADGYQFALRLPHVVANLPSGAMARGLIPSPSIESESTKKVTVFPAPVVHKTDTDPFYVEFVVPCLATREFPLIFFVFTVVARKQIAFFDDLEMNRNIKTGLERSFIFKFEAIY